MRVLLALALGACLTGCPAPGPAAGPAAARHGAKESPKMDTVAILQRLCAEVSAPRATVAGLEEALARAGIQGARVVPLPGAGKGGEPSHARMPAPQGLTLASLRAAFGEPGAVPLLHPDSPEEHIFYPAAPAGAPYRCAIIAEVDGDTLRALTLRRDPAG